MEFLFGLIAGACAGVAAVLFLPKVKVWFTGEKAKVADEIKAKL